MFRYACFISYRGGNRQRENPYISGFVRTLKTDLRNELELLFEPELADIFLDADHLRTGGDHDALVSDALCRSICMICIWTPIYFSRDHPYCAREYRAMEDLENHRYALLGTEASLTPPYSLILPLVIRKPEDIQAHIKDRRFYYDLSSLSVNGQGEIHRTEEYLKIVRDFAAYIYQKYKELQKIPDPCQDCLNFRILSEEEIQPWLNDVLRSG